MVIPWNEFKYGILSLAPDCVTQEIAPAPDVHVFDEDWLQETFWPYFCEVKRELDLKLSVRPMTNNAKRGICDEINKRLIAELTLSCRVRHGDENVAPGAVESTVLIGRTPLNLVSDGCHRNAILALSKNGGPWRPKFVEAQLSYAQYQTTSLVDALERDVSLRECWL